jgi:tetratricopeptide (TPR) repeat protein
MEQPRAVALAFLLGLMGAACEPDPSRAGQSLAAEAVEGPAAIAAGLAGTLRAEVADEHASAVDAAAADPQASAGTLQLLAHFAYLTRHLELATWLYARAAQVEPGDASNWSNLGLGLTELAMAGGAGADATLRAAVATLREAVRLAPEAAAAHGNLGVALLQSGELAQAETHLGRAIALDPAMSLFHSHLGEVLVAAGRPEEAGMAFARAHRLDPFDGVLLRVVQGGGPAGEAYAAAPRDYCAVDYDCMRSCPGGIIGRINAVTCEMEQASAILACREGAPYASEYDCSMDLGSIPFILPGMFPGLSIVTPVGRIDVLVQGNGRVDFRVKLNGPGGLELATAGRYEPRTGVSVTRLVPGVSASLYNGGTVAPALNRLGLNPTSLKYDRDLLGPGGGNVKLEAYDTTVFHLH